MNTSVASALHVALLGTALAVRAPTEARADGWWEVACNADGAEGDGGCSNPNNPNGCSCDSTRSTRSASKRAASIGAGLGLMAFVGYCIGRKRRRGR